MHLEAHTALENVIGRLTFHGLMSVGEPSIHVLYPTSPHCLYVLTMIEMRVPDRDTGEPIKLVHTAAVPNRMCDNPEAVKRILTSEIRKFWLHELDESLRYDGELIRDPHAGEKR